jgi:NADH-quinone oxidoreductase subunit E
MEYIGTMLNMAFIRVYEVATFYTMFQLSPVGKKAHIQVCGTTPCMLRGSEELLALCRKKIHPEPHHLNSDGSLSWEEVECLGACVNAPMVQVWKDTYEDLTPETLSGLIDDWQAGRKTNPGPQIDRKMSMPVGGATTLLDKTLYNKQRTFKRVEAPPAPPPVAIAPAAVAAPVNAPVISRVAKIEKTTAKKAVPAKVAPQREAGTPELLKKPRGKADDLKLIWGIGPAFEKLLNKTGIWHFDQVASWQAKDIDHVDALLKGFHGRIRRDEWVKQAKKLARGWRPEKSIGEKPGRK